MKIKWTWLSILFVILMLQVDTLYAKEDMKVVYVNIHDIKICFPESCYVLTQNIDEKEPYLERVGATREHVEEYYKTNNIFLHAIAADLSYEIVCTCKDNDNQQFLSDLSIVGDAEVKQLAESMANTYKEYGYENISSDYYDASNEKFAVISFTTTAEDKKVCCEQYFFTLNGKSYYFTLRVFGDDITPENHIMMKNVADSIYFFRNASIMDHMYENSEFGIYFEVPKGWEEKLHDSSNKYLQAQFAQANMMGETFQVYAYDIWSDFDTVRRITTTRDKLDTTAGMEKVKSNKNYIESFYNDFSKVKILKDNRTPLIYEDEPVLLEHKDVDGNYYQQNYCVIKQGILYVFQYGYYEGMDLHKDEIEAVLASVKISNPGVFENDEQAYKEMAKFTYAALAVIVTLVFAFILLIYLYFKTQGQAKSDE